MKNQMNKDMEKFELNSLRKKVIDQQKELSLRFDAPKLNSNGTVLLPMISTRRTTMSTILLERPSAIP
jgi:hypothetical protein